MNCLHCNREYSGDPRSYYCGTTCRKRAENARARLKRLPSTYLATVRKMQQAESEGDPARANRAKARAHRILKQMETMRPIFTQHQRWLNAIHQTIGRLL
jgi:hypothetical protein